MGGLKWPGLLCEGCAGISLLSGVVLGLCRNWGGPDGCLIAASHHWLSTALCGGSVMTKWERGDQEGCLRAKILRGAVRG